MVRAGGPGARLTEITCATQATAVTVPRTPGGWVPVGPTGPRGSDPHGPGPAGSRFQCSLVTALAEPLVDPPSPIVDPKSTEEPQIMALPAPRVQHRVLPVTGRGVRWRGEVRTRGCYFTTRGRYEYRGTWGGCRPAAFRGERGFRKARCAVRRRERRRMLRGSGVVPHFRAGRPGFSRGCARRPCAGPPVPVPRHRANAASPG